MKQAKKPKSKDIAGQRFGKLIAIKKILNYRQKAREKNEERKESQHH